MPFSPTTPGDLDRSARVIQRAYKSHNSPLRQSKVYGGPRLSIHAVLHVEQAGMQARKRAVQVRVAGKSRTRTIPFDSVFESGVPEEKVFATLLVPLLDDAFAGRSSTVLCVSGEGAANSAGAQWMLGGHTQDVVHNGAVRRTIHQCLHRLTVSKEMDEDCAPCGLSLSAYETYDTQVMDLLADAPASVERKSRNGEMDVVELKQQKISSVNEADSTLHVALLNVRHGAHLVIQVNVHDMGWVKEKEEQVKVPSPVRWDSEDEGEGGGPQRTEGTTQIAFHLMDSTARGVAGRAVKALGLLIEQESGNEGAASGFGVSSFRLCQVLRAPLMGTREWSGDRVVAVAIVQGIGDVEALDLVSSMGAIVGRKQRLLVPDEPPRTLREKLLIAEKRLLVLSAINAELQGKHPRMDTGPMDLSEISLGGGGEGSSLLRESLGKLQQQAHKATTGHMKKIRALQKRLAESEAGKQTVEEQLSKEQHEMMEVRQKHRVHMRSVQERTKVAEEEARQMQLVVDRISEGAKEKLKALEMVVAAQHAHQEKEIRGLMERYQEQNKELQSVRAHTQEWKSSPMELQQQVEEQTALLQSLQAKYETFSNQLLEWRSSTQALREELRSQGMLKEDALHDMKELCTPEQLERFAKTIRE